VCDWCVIMLMTLVMMLMMMLMTLPRHGSVRCCR
jgi:hypothetical protein